MKYTVIITKDEDGYYVVNVPALPGCFTQGKTKKEALGEGYFLKNFQEGYKEWEKSSMYFII